MTPGSGSLALFILTSGFSFTTFSGYRDAFDGFPDVPYRCYILPDSTDEFIQYSIVEDVRENLEGVCNYNVILADNDVETALKEVVFNDPDPPTWVVMLNDKLYPMPGLWMTLHYLHQQLLSGDYKSAALGTPTASNILPDKKEDYNICSFVVTDFTQELPVGFFMTERHLRMWGLRGGRDVLTPVKSRMHNMIDRPMSIPYAVHSKTEKGSDGIFTPDRAVVVPYTPA